MWIDTWFTTLDTTNHYHVSLSLILQLLQLCNHQHSMPLSHFLLATFAQFEAPGPLWLDKIANPALWLVNFTWPQHDWTQLLSTPRLTLIKRLLVSGVWTIILCQKLFSILIVMKLAEAGLAACEMAGLTDQNIPYTLSHCLLPIHTYLHTYNILSRMHSVH